MSKLVDDPSKEFPMLVDTDNLVSTEEFRRDFEKFVKAAKGNGPVAVMKNQKVVGIFVSPEDYEVLSGESLGRLIESRMKGETVSQAEAEVFIAERAAKRRKR
jgi:PHD/YefM family antitoxin component YafN of YafNO toxin-antitoxin module